MKLLKRLAALVLCASMSLYGVCAIVNAASFGEDFGGYADGEIPSDCWQITTPPGSIIDVREEKLSVEIGSGFSGKAIAQYTLPEALSGIVAVEYSARVDTPSCNFCAPYIYSDSGTLAVCTMFGDNGKISSYANGSYQTLFAYELGHEYDVKHVINYNNGTFSLYIDGVCYITDAAFRNKNSANLSYMQFYSERKNTQVYFDNLNIYTLAAPELKSLVFIDSDGGEYECGDRLPADICGLRLEYDTVVSVGSMAGLCMEDENGAKTDCRIAEQSDASSITAYFDAPLSGQTFKLHIPEVVSVKSQLSASAQSYDFGIENGALAVAGVYACRGGAKMKLADGAADVPADITAIEIEFSGDPEKDSINEANITIDGCAYSGSYSNGAWHMQLTDGLDAEKTYVIGISGVKSADGQSLEEKFSFTTVKDMLCFENFEFVDEGSLPADGWKLVSGTAQVVYDNALGSRVLELTKRPTVGTSEIQLETDFSNAGITAGDVIVIDFDVYADYSANASIPYIYNSEGTNLVGAVFDKSGNIIIRNNSQNVTVCGYSEKQWHNVQVCCDFLNSRFNYLLDGRIAASGFIFRNNNKLGIDMHAKISLYIDGSNTGTVLADNFKIYKASAPRLLADRTVFVRGAEQTADADAVFAGKTDIRVSYDGVMETAEFELYRGDTKVETKTTADGGNGFVITPVQPLAYNCDYTLKAVSARSAVGKEAALSELNFTTDNNTVYISDADFTSDGVNAKVVNNTQAPVDAIALLAAYADGEMKGVTLKKLTLEAGRSEFELELNSAGDKKLYLWQEDVVSPIEYVVYTSSGAETAALKTPWENNTIEFAKEIEKSYPDTDISVEGNAAAGTPVILLALEPNTDITNLTVEDIIYIGQTLCSGDGSFSFDFKLPDDLQSGSYRLIVGAAGALAHAEGILNYTGSGAIEELIGEINAAEPSAAIELILENAARLGINISDIEDMNDEVKTAFEASVTEARPYASYEAFKKHYRNAYYTSLFNSSNDVSAYIDKYAADLGIDLSTDGIPGKAFEKLSDLRGKTDGIVSAKTDYADAEDIVGFYCRTAGLCAVNMSSRGTILEFCEMFAQQLGIVLDDNYKNLTETKREKLAIALTEGVEYASATDLAQNFVRRLSDIAKETTVVAGGSGSGGSSTGGGSAFAGITSVTAEQQSAYVPVFGDVNEDDWFAGYVNRLGKLNIISGDENGNYNPYADITRAELVKMLVTAADCYNAELTADFDDVDPTKWYSPYIASAHEVGIAGGYDNRFMPDENVTRQDAAIMAAKTIAFLGRVQTVNAVPEFADAHMIADYAKEYVSIIVEAGIMSGMGDSSFAPLENMTRAQAAVVICGITEVLK